MDLGYLIVTNNPEVRGTYKNVIFVEGGFEDTLLKARDMIHKGYGLISHPLGASIRMFYSPYRSILIDSKDQCSDETCIEIIESGIENYRKTMLNRKPDMDNSKDYAMLDKDLLLSAIKEHERLNHNLIQGV